MRRTTAAVGVTLTAANRVFLMEPSPDPATELQAAGRIHRLGQTKEVLIKRFAFRNTIEHAIVDLHEEIKAKRVPAGAGKDNDVVKSVLKKHNLHKEVHTADGHARSGQQGAAWRVQQASRAPTTGSRRTGWSRCRCCQRHCKKWFEVMRGSWPDRRRDDPSLAGQCTPSTVRSLRRLDERANANPQETILWTGGA